MRFFVVFLAIVIIAFLAWGLLVLGFLASFASGPAHILPTHILGRLAFIGLFLVLATGLVGAAGLIFLKQWARILVLTLCILTLGFHIVVILRYAVMHHGNWYFLWDFPSPLVGVIASSALVAALCWRRVRRLF